MTAQAELRVREAADVATRAVSRAAIWTFAALLVGGLAAANGGFLGSPPTIAAGNLGAAS